MADTDQDQKTEEPTGKRLQEAQEKGQFARSQELNVVFALAAAFSVVMLTASSAAQTVAEFASGIFANLHRVNFDPGELPSPFGRAGKVVATVLAPVLAASILATIISGGLQSGFRLSPKALKFGFEKLDPIKGFGRIFSQRTLVMAGIDFMKMVVIGFLLFLAARTLLSDPLFNAPVEAMHLGRFMHESIVTLLARLLLALGCIAAISYAYERYKNHEQMRMTRQEVKDEHKQAEGDAMVKGQMRRMARRLLQKQMLAAVPLADVVVTNPTHYAVALKYERGVDSAPVVLAKGDNRFARRIKELAAQHGVPTVENKPVARMLFAVGKVGESIPPELFQAVAGILAFVYQTHRLYFHDLRTRRAAASALPTSPTV
jgi:flagellar biosynthesis protein FlhB